MKLRARFCFSCRMERSCAGNVCMCSVVRCSHTYWIGTLPVIDTPAEPAAPTREGNTRTGTKDGSREEPSIPPRREMSWLCIKHAWWDPEAEGKRGGGSGWLPFTPAEPGTRGARGPDHLSFTYRLSSTVNPSVHVWSSGRFRCIGVSPSVHPVSVGPVRRSGGGGRRRRRRRRRRRKAGGSAPADRSADQRGSALKEPNPKNVRPDWKTPRTHRSPVQIHQSDDVTAGVSWWVWPQVQPVPNMTHTYDLWPRLSRFDVALLWRATCENTVICITVFINANNVQIVFNVSRCKHQPGLV